MNKNIVTIVGLFLAFAIFIAINIVGTTVIRGARVDLTDQKLFTLSSGSKVIAKKIDEPITLTLYYSETKASQLPAALKSYAQRVREVLREFAAASSGKIKLSIVNPEPFSEVEDKAVADGIVGLTARGGEKFYFGLVGTNSTDKKEIIPFFDPQKEEFLEYDVTRLVYLLATSAKKTVGLLSYLPLEGVTNNPLMRGQNSPPWQITNQIKDFFEVKTIAPDAAELPKDLNVVMLVHPKGISDKMLYLLDQFVLGGGRLLVFVDPFCEADMPPGINPMQAVSIPKNSDLKKLFDAWGVGLVQEKFVGDRTAALKVQMGSQRAPEAVTFVAWLGLTKDHANFDNGDSVTGVLQGVNVASAGALEKKTGASITFQPLLMSGTDSMLMDAKQLQMIPDPKTLLAGFQGNGQTKYAIAARLSGKVKSAFPEGDPNAPAPAEGQPRTPQAGHLAESKDSINVIAVADCDILTDRFWVNESRLGNIVLGYQKMADNGDFVLGALDSLAGSTDLMSVRARGKFQRPFDRVEQIRKNAEQKWQAQQQELQSKLTEIDAKVNELQKKTPDGGQVLFTPEMQAQVNEFRKVQLDTRKKLRDVKYQSEREERALESRLRILNMGLMPVAVGVLAVGLSLYRVNRRRSVRTTAGKLS